jgi:citrate lyase beta subunit
VARTLTMRTASGPSDISTRREIISAAHAANDSPNSSLLPLANNPFTLFNADTAAASRRPTLPAFFHGSHAAFRLGANAEADGTDLHTDTGRRPLLNDPASLRGRVLNDVVVRKARRNHESCQSSTSEHCAHGKSPSLLVHPSQLAWGSFGSEYCQAEQQETAIASTAARSSPTATGPAVSRQWLIPVVPASKSRKSAGAVSPRRAAPRTHSVAGLFGFICGAVGRGLVFMFGQPSEKLGGH